MTMTTGQISNLYAVLNGLKLTELDGKEKYAVVKMMYKMKPIAEAFEEFRKDYPQKVKPQGWEDIEEDYRKWKEEEKEDKCSLAEETVNMLRRMEHDYLTNIHLGINEEAAQEKDIEIEYLSEEVFEKLLGSNDLYCDTSMLLADCLLKKEEKKD